MSKHRVNLRSPSANNNETGMNINKQITTKKIRSQLTTTTVERLYTHKLMKTQASIKIPKDTWDSLPSEAR